MRIFNNKRAVEVQFNWIFILIAGGLILLLFVGFIGRQQQAAQIKLSSQVLADLDSVFTGAGVSAGAAELIEIPDLLMEFTCDSYSISTTIKPTSKAISIFAPSSIKSNYMVLWAKEWSAPYKITNFLYITSPNIRYIFVGDSQFTTNVFNNTPPQRILMSDREELAMNKELIGITSVQNIANKNDYKMKMLFFDGVLPEMPDNIKRMNDKDVSAIAIRGTDTQDSINYGNLDFYQKMGDSFEMTGSSVYVGEASLYGAIFSDDMDYYNCMMSKAFIKYNAVSKIYLNRMKQIYNLYQAADPCKIYYATSDVVAGVLNPIETILTILQTGFADVSIGASSLSTPIRNVDNINQNTLIGSCVSIY